MYLQSLEIVGFKSFATKTVLHFHRGVTAVVGPNGCGKSNILDSIRWVLGEQSAKALRGGEMADVIFGGTDTRQPHNMAEVSLTFAECEKELGVEWHELCITRRVFRDGKSEYLINGKPCRLKDIHELFMDTGIGRSAYSIMEQGKLDQILSSRPDDRRAIFEEAAGITKFKSQKKEALRKLEYTDSNLLRVTDIIKEVKRQIGSLQRQAGKARRYQGLQSDLSILDTHLSHRSYKELEHSIEALAASIDQSAEVRLVQEREIAEQEEECGVVRSQLAVLDSGIEQSRAALQNVRNQIFSGENRVETNRERKEEFREQATRARAEIDAFHARISEQESELERTETQLTELLDLLRTEESALQSGTSRATEAQKERIDAERRADAFAHRLHTMDNRLSDLRGKVSTATGRRDAARQRLEQLQSQQASMEQTLIGLTVRAETAVTAHVQAGEAMTLAKQAQEAAQSFHDEAQRTRQHADVEWNALGKQLAERESRRELLCQLEREGEGLGEGTQAILRGLNRPDFFQAGILGTLAALIDVPTEDIPAVEAALGAASRSVVFKDADVAAAALQTLKAAAQGRAAVLMADWPNSSQESLSLPEGALVWASSLVKASEPVRVVVGRLLEGVAVVADLETAFRLKKEHPNLAFAARTGEFISRDGVAYGGADGEVSSSALLRRSQIAALERDVTTLREEETRLATARDAAITALEQAIERLREARDHVNHTQSLLSSARSDELLATRELHDTRRRSEALAMEVGTLEAQSQKLEEQILQDQQQLDALATEIAQVREERSSAQAQIATLRDAETEAAAALAEVRLRVATERQHQQALTQQRVPLQARLRELAQSIASRERDITNQEQKVISLETESSSLLINITQWKEELLAVEQEIAQKTSERSKLQERVETLEISLRTVRKELMELQDRRSREEVRLTELRLRAESIRDHISRRYQIDLTNFKPDSYALLKVITVSKERKSLVQKGSMEEPLETGVDGNLTIEETDSMVRSPEQQSNLPAEIDFRENAIPWEKIEVMVAELTERVDSMGPVNIEAIQEFEELEERYNFLEKQNTDLINAKEELLEVISRINKTTKVLFAETFERVRVNFQEMFTELFGGGKANLLLVDDSNPLESGIEIIARPPGKQLQSISLLSGGERTMTAVALLFAIYMVKPSPFCVLDEMDAPLDESNIGRFIKLLDRFVGQSQFFVITHNKRTMSRADMLYGVTMEERGVTKLISVKFHAKEEGKVLDQPETDQEVKSEE
ncbi:MAG: chromosome segregation protein SMC [Verrucomicrobia bacterium RIFCSPHIGHO2_12_FULL_41_10]|nr:MAG: chromosome segregation protein SMC [Verrucomicrobia bacterium RIFCSPHIGHO2_12_FULL_41_10]HLB34039.1 chromosome segregation protein SMC [Chthoniobacterales bacterium]